MSQRITKRAANAKSAHCRIRNQKRTIRNQISPVMQKVQSLLPDSKSALHLHILTNHPLSNCQKVLAGVRGENLELIIALLRSEMGRDVLFALMGDTSPEWFSKYRKQLDVNSAFRDLDEAKRKVEALQKECRA